MHNKYGNIIDTNITDTKGKSRVYLQNMDTSILKNIIIKHEDIETKCNNLMQYPEIYRNNELLLDINKLNNKHFTEFDKQIKKMTENYKKNTDLLLKIIESILEKKEITKKDSIEEERINLNNISNFSSLDVYKYDHSKEKEKIYNLKPITESQLDEYIIKASEHISNLLKMCHLDYKEAVTKLICGYESFISELYQGNNKK